MELEREIVKSILTCIDDGDFKRATRELERLPTIPINRGFRLFLEGWVPLLNNEKESASARFKDLMIYAEGLDKPELHYESQLLGLFAFALFLVSDKHPSRTVQKRGALLTEPDREIIDLSETREAPGRAEFSQLITSLQIVLECERISAQEECWSDLTTSLILKHVELPCPTELAAEVFHKEYSDQKDFVPILHLGNLVQFRELSYDRFIILVDRVFRNSVNDLGKNLAEHLASLLKRIEPREGNSHGNVPLYKKLKPKLNELTLDYYLCAGELDQGMEWLEGMENGQGQDFLRIESHVEPSYLEKLKKAGQQPTGLQALLDKPEFHAKFVVPEKDHPVLSPLEKIVDFHPAFDSYEDETQLDIRAEIIKFHSVIRTLTTVLTNPVAQDPQVKETLYKRIYSNTEAYLGWEDQHKEEIMRSFLPFELGQVLESHREYDDAIFVYQRSLGTESEREDAIRGCQFNLGRFIDDNLRRTLIGLNVDEQKQLLGYAKLFKLEVKLRSTVDAIMKKQRNNQNWFQYENSPLLKYAKEASLDRKMKYEKDPFYKEQLKTLRLIDFTTLPELRSIIELNWEHFEDQFGDREQFLALLVPISRIRNDIAHSRLLDGTQLRKLIEVCEQLDKVLFRESSIGDARKSRLQGSKDTS